MAADILVVATPIWLGDKSSVCTRTIGRLYGTSSILNDRGQYAYYGRVGGCLVTGNEDGIKHVAMNVLYSLQHLGYTIPPQADAGWIGEAGPGASYGDDGAGLDNDFTNRNVTFIRGICCTWPGCSAIPAASRRTATRRPCGTPAPARTTPIRNTGRRHRSPAAQPMAASASRTEVSATLASLTPDPATASCTTRASSPGSSTAGTLCRLSTIPPTRCSRTAGVLSTMR